MQSVIEVDSINKAFEKKKVLKNVSFSVRRGEMAAVVGESGSGKTTLLNILGLISAADSGSYRINGEAVKNINSRKAMLLRRREIGYLFQNYGLVEDETVEWNLKLAYAYKRVPRRVQNEQIERYLEEFRMSCGRSDKVFWLSGGEQQRLALIRLMIKDCGIILADEPTGSLDLRNRDMVMDRLRELNRRGKTIVMVTHDKELAESCARVIDIV